MDEPRLQPGLQPAPDPPELPEGAETPPRWPVWYAPVGFGAALLLTLIAVVVLGVVAAAAGVDVDEEPPGLTIAGTLVQALVLMGTAVYFASLTRKPRPWHFGLRPTRFWPAVGWAALGMFSFYVFALTYFAIFQPDGEQEVTESLGADESTLALIVAGFVVIVVAPVAEEFFFRGFFYRALRGSLPVLAAAAIDGVIFGAIHFTGGDTLSLLPMLAALGFMFCLVYERTGSLYPVIALHALNNSIAYAAQEPDGWPASLALGAAMIAGCAIVPRIAGRSPRPAPALR